MKVPTDKDDLIKYLMDRLDYSEQAIVEAENCITNERAKRLQLKDELQERNDELRKIVEGEKKTLQDKVHLELEKTLNAAIQAKVKAEDELKAKTNECNERDMMCQELDLQSMRLRHETREIRVKDEKLESESKEMKEELDKYKTESKTLKEENTKLNEDIEEAHAVIKKLDEARYTLNRLLGPNGVLNERERQKFLKQRGEEEYDMNMEQENPGNNGANAGGASGAGAGAGAASRNMLGSNNEYFYNDQNNNGAEGNNEDDFWYGAPKGGAYEQPGAGGGNEYQSYIGNTQAMDPNNFGAGNQPRVPGR